MKSLRLLALAWLQTAPSALQAPPTPPTGQAPLQAPSPPLVRAIVTSRPSIDAS